MTPLRSDIDRPSPVDMCFLWCTDAEEDSLVQRLFSKGNAQFDHLPPTRRRFYRNSLVRLGRSFSVVGAKASDQGSLNMLVALQDVYQHFTPRLTVLVGIAGALDEELNVGDVVIAKNVYLYERGKDFGDRIGRELRSFSMKEDVKNVVDGIRGDLRREGTYNLALATYGSGEKVVASELSSIRDYLLTVDRKIAAVEMESGGFFQYFETPGFKRETELWLMVKGISDHADPNKRDGDQALAAGNSVDAAVELGTRLLAAWND